MAKITIPSVGETYVGDDPAITKVKRITFGVSSGSPDVITEATGTFALLTIPAGCLVTDVRGRVLEAFTATVNCNVGDSDDTDGYLTEAVLASTAYSSDTVNVLKRNVSGFVDSTGADGGRVYDIAHSINVTVDTASPVVGKAEIYVTYALAGLL